MTECFSWLVNKVRAAEAGRFLDEGPSFPCIVEG
jgi:hypothetical protein